MNDIIHEIFSEIHWLLSIATEDELRHASSAQNTSSHVRDALLALAAEKAITAQQVGAKQSRASRRPGHRPTAVLLGGESDASGVISAILKELGKRNKNDIQKFCDSVGFPVSIQAKDSRDRVFRRVTGLIHSLPQKDLSRALLALRTTDDSQTEGWVGVIRGDR